MRIIIWIVSLAAILLAAAIAAAGPGTRMGLWDYSTGLQIIRQAAMPVMGAAVLSAIALLVALWRARSIALMPLVATLAAGAAAYAPIAMRDAAESNPFIHDITTDFENPPPIIAGAAADRKNPPDYVGAEQAPRSELTIAEAQQEAFPDIAPIRIDLSVSEAAARARAVIADMKLDVLSDGQTDEGWLIEATHTSAWFGFVDDFVVRITQDETGAVVDIRSKSRVGVSDLGANAERIRAFIDGFENADG